MKLTVCLALVAAGVLFTGPSFAHQKSNREFPKCEID